MTGVLINEWFSLREGETMTLVDMKYSRDRWFAVRVVPVPLPGTPVAPYRNLPNTASEQCAIISAHKNALGEWQWLHLSPNTKERVGDWLIDVCKVDRDRWYFVQIGLDMAQAASLTRREREANKPPNAEGGSE